MRSIVAVVLGSKFPICLCDRLAHQSPHAPREMSSRPIRQVMPWVVLDGLIRVR